MGTFTVFSVSSGGSDWSHDSLLNLLDFENLRISLWTDEDWVYNVRGLMLSSLACSSLAFIFSLISLCTKRFPSIATMITMLIGGLFAVFALGLYTYNHF